MPDFTVNTAHYVSAGERDQHPVIMSSSEIIHSRTRIAVCDDVQEDLERISSGIEEIASGRDISIDQFSSAADLLDADPYDLVFLDILMDGMDGMMAARLLRKRRASCMIVFVTNSREHLASGYEVDAFRYLLKPFQDQELRRILDQALARLDGGMFTFRADGEVHRIPFRDISYIEAQKRYSIVRLLDGTELVVHESISQIELRIDRTILMRCQKSFIVNLDEIRGLRRGEVVLRSGAVISVSRALIADVRARLVEHFTMF